MSRVNTANNKACREMILAQLAQAHDATLTPGFYGKVEIKWVVKDGSIQQDLEIEVKQVKRMGPGSN